MSWRSLVKLAVDFCRLHAVHVQVAGLLFAAVGALLVLLASDDFLAPPEPLCEIYSDQTYFVFGENGTGAVTGEFRRLAARGGEGGTSASAGSDTMVIHEEGNWAYLWVTLTLSQLLLMTHFAIVAFMPHERLNIMRIEIFSMLVADIAEFMIIFFWALLLFFQAMFTLYPRSGPNSLPLADRFNRLTPGLQNLVELAFIGEPVRRITLAPLLQLDRDAI